MRPLTALTGIVLGSCVATTFGLGATLVVFLFLSGEHPQFQSELPMLALYVAIFVGLTALAGHQFRRLGATTALAPLGPGCPMDRAAQSGGPVLVDARLNQ